MAGAQPEQAVERPRSRGGLKYAGMMLGLDVVGWLALGGSDSDYIDRRIPGGSFIDVPALAGIGAIMLAGNGIFVHCLRGSCDRYAVGYSLVVRIGVPLLTAGVTYAIERDEQNTDKLNVAGDLARDAGFVALLGGTVLDYILVLANPDFRFEDKPSSASQTTWLVKPAHGGGVVGLAGAF